MLKEFKKFISRGNVMDLAVGVIVGGAFGKIVTSLVNDILMPIIGVIIGGIDFSNLSITIKDASVNYGMFIQNVIDFLIVAFCIFMITKALNKLDSLVKKEEAQKEAKAETKVVKEESEEVKLLKEINKNLKKLSKEK